MLQFTTLSQLVAPTRFQIATRTPKALGKLNDIANYGSTRQIHQISTNHHHESLPLGQ